MADMTENAYCFCPTVNEFQHLRLAGVLVENLRKLSPDYSKADIKNFCRSWTTDFLFNLLLSF
ncbi:MAG: hypothetical protein AAFR26_20825, partial [Cyanobacteria bacterium J06626_4]